MRSPLVGTVQFSDLSRGKHAQAKPPILRNQSQSKRRQRQTEWSCASEFSHPISSAAKCGSSSRLMGSGMPDYGFGRCDGHHEMVVFRVRKSVRAEDQQSKRLRSAAIVPNCGHYVAYARPPGRVHRAVPSYQNRQAAFWQPMAARDQARRLPHHCFVQKLLVESGCRMSQRWDDFCS